MKKILCTFLIAMLVLTVSAQNDNIQRPPKKTEQQAPPPKGTQPTKPAKQKTQQSTPSHAEPVDSAKVPQDTTTSYPQSTNPIQQTNLQTIPQVLTSPLEPEIVKPTTGYLNGHEWVDLGLSVKWATMNVGATSPEDSGGHYAWGEITTKSRYDWDNCFDLLKPKKYINDSSWGTYKLSGLTKITPSSGHDTARENWGGTWRMPTDAEYEELCKKCTWTWITQGRYKGYKVTGPNGNSIFLPAAGWRTENRMHYVGEFGLYWASSIGSSYSYVARGLRLDSRTQDTDDLIRREGRSVRPVTD